VDKLKRDAKEKMKEYEDKLQKKNKVINDLLTESENIKTEKLTLEASLTEQSQREAKLQAEL
jgi:predicted  nucleic acid-binding Zn-ribbon protein